MIYAWAPKSYGVQLDVEGTPSVTLRERHLDVKRTSYNSGELTTRICEKIPGFVACGYFVLEEIEI